MKKIILVTGATSGFGKAIAEKFAAANNDVIITGRRQDRLDDLKSSIESAFHVDVLALCFDVRNRAEVRSNLENLPVKWRNVDLLVNNAGLAAGRDYFDEASNDDWEQMIDTNVKGLLYVSRAILPAMIERGAGHIINIGSIAGLEVYEKGNVYCATKHAVGALSKAMRIDLLRHAIRVTNISPGMAETEFSLVRLKGDEEAAGAVYKGVQPLSAEDVADAVYYCASVPPHVCINELVLTPTAQASSVYLHRDPS